MDVYITTTPVVTQLEPLIWNEPLYGRVEIATLYVTLIG